jgi:hypothetical protein
MNWMTETSPWADIQVPTSDYNVKRVAGATAVPCYWGRDPSGSCLFVAELEGDHAVEFRRQTVPVNGIDIDLRNEVGQQRLVLTLEKQADRDLFEGLCRTLALALESASDSASSLAVAMIHLHRWKTFMAGKGQHMSGEQVRGLFAELTFLRELIGHLGASAAVEAWMGPERSHQDFIFGNSAIEIKSLSGAERSSVRISSEDQLESLNDNLFLRIYRLSDMPDASSARSLNALILELQASLDTADAVEAFDTKLVAHFYAPLPEYDQPAFVVQEIRSYRVDGEFPRLVRASLPAGVSRVKFDIELEQIEDYACNEVLGGT